MSGLVLQAVTVSIGTRQLVGPLDLSVARGQVVSILGPSGAGKSSLLAFLCGVLPSPLHAQGSVLLDGDNISNLPPEQRRLGILFQDDLLFPHLSVAGNLAFGLRSAGDRRNRRRIISAARAPWRNQCRRRRARCCSTSHSAALTPRRARLSAP